MRFNRGFTPLVTAQCVYVNDRAGVLIFAYVDDFLCFGSKPELGILLGDLQTEFECTGDVLGPGSDEVKALKFLGRSIRLTSTGIEWEGDDKHAKAFLEKLNAGELRGVETPGTKVESASVIAEGVVLSDAESKRYRGLVALLNFMSQDRPDIGYASKEVSKSMSSPKSGDWPAVKRIGRYLSLYPRCVSVFEFQDYVADFTGFTDSDGWRPPVTPEYVWRLYDARVSLA